MITVITIIIIINRATSVLLVYNGRSSGLPIDPWASRYSINV